MTLQTIPDILGADATVAIAAEEAHASWGQIVVKGTGIVRVGGKNVSATEGIPIIAGEDFFFPFMPQAAYRLDSVRLYIPVGATVSVAWLGTL